MKNVFKKFGSLLLFAVILLFSVSFESFSGIDFPSFMDLFAIKAEASASGTLSETLTWEYNESTGTLTISGSGQIGDYSSTKRPWEEYKAQVQSIVIGDNVTNIGKSAFYGFDNLTSVTIGSGTETVGADDFSGNKIESFYVSEENPYLCAENGVLFSKDKSIIFKYPIAKQGDYTLPDSVKVIKSYAFGGYKNKLIINTVLDEIEPSAFDTAYFSSTTCSVYFMAGQPLLSYTDSFDKPYVLLYYSKESEDKWTFDEDGLWNGYDVYPYEDGETVEFDPSLYIASGYCGDNFSDGKNLAWMIDENGTLTIKGKGHMRNYGFKEFHTGEHNITDAPWSEYYYDVNKLVIEDGVMGIGNYAFFVMDTLKGELILPGSIRRIGESAFRACAGFEGEIVVPEGVKTLKYMAFLGCNNVHRVNLPSTYVGVFNSQIFDMENLLEINIHEDNEKFCSVDGAVLSKDLKNLIIVPRGKTGSYTVPDKVKTFDTNAFNNCSLSEIVLPAGYTEEFNYNKFSTAENLESIKYHKDNAKYSSVDGAVLTKDGKTLLYVPRGKTGSFTVPETVETIETYAFRHTHLNEIIIPENVKTIKQQAIYYNSKNSHLSVIVKGNLTANSRFVQTTASENTGWADVYFLDGEPKINNAGNFVIGNVNMYYLAGTEDKWTFDDNGLWKGFTVTKFYGFGVKDTTDHSTHNTEIRNKSECTCTDYGYTGDRFCNDCNSVYEIGVMTEPCHNYISTVTDPTCTDQGYTTHTCECGETYADNYTDATGHSVNDDGVCDTCGEQIEELSEFEKFYKKLKNILTFAVDFIKNVIFHILSIIKSLF